MRKVTWTGTGSVEFSDDGAGRPPLPDAQCVRLRVTVAGICGTDLHIVDGRLRFIDPPAVLGHEIAGVVEECGAEVRRVRPGDRVKCDSVVGCGRCAWCLQGATQFCPDGWEFGITRAGGWAEWLVAPERNLHPLPDEIPDDVGAILDVEVFGALRRPGIRPGETVVILGPGPAGLVALQLARLWGAGTVILCGTRPERLALGARLGADHIVNVNEEPAVPAVLALTGGAGADLAFEAAGSPRAVHDAIEALRPQGRAVFYGVHGRPMPEFPIDRAVLKDLTIYGALANRTGWEEAISLVASGGLDLASLITHAFPLERAADAVAALSAREGGAVKGVLLVAAGRLSR